MSLNPADHTPEILPYDTVHSVGVAKLQGQLGYEISPATFHSRIRKLKERGNFELLVLLDGGEVSGYVAFEFLLTLQYDNPICHIMNLVVDQSKRGRGLGNRLVTQVKEIAESHNAPILHLTSGNKPERMAAHQFYEHYGFAKSGSRFTLDLEEGVT